MTDDHDTLLSRIALSMLPGMNVSLASRLIELLGSPSGVLQATESELKGIPSIPKGIISTQLRYQAMESSRQEVDFLKAKGVKAHWYQDRNYPERLLKAERAPVIVYTLGDTDLNNLHMVGIVGTRHSTVYGNSFTERLVADLAEKAVDVATVSGLAYGIDVAAHRASLANGIPTVAIVGHGMTTLYPAAHRETAGRMVRNGGMILTDYRHDASISGYNFLSRNRLIAALSDALIVVESGEHGGALATARLAVKCGTPVFAVPGRVSDNYSVGCNNLIANGIARCITSCDDLIKAMKWPVKETVADKTEAQADITSSLSREERLLLHHIMTARECDNDMLVAVTDMPASKVMTIMIGLEMKGIVAMEPGNRYRVIQTIDPARLLINQDI